MRDVIIELRAKGRTLTEIGSMFGLHHRTVHFVVSGGRKSSYPSDNESTITILEAALAKCRSTVSYLPVTK